MHSSPNNTRRVVIVLGTNYSGSHLLSHLLGAHSACFGVGELHRYEQLMDGGGDAPVVSEYNSPLFEGLSEQPIRSWYGTLADRFAEQQSISRPVIIDNSKKVRWVKRVAQAENLDLRLVHLIRDPRALVFRWLNTYDTDKRRRTQRLRVAKRMPARAAQILPGDWVNVFVYKWLHENRQISQFMAQSKHARAVVTYHNTVFETEATLGRLMPRLGLVYEPDQLRFGEGSNFGTTKVAHADALRQSEIRPDLKWQTQLDQAAAQKVAENRDVQSYLRDLGLELAPDGIVQSR